MTRRDLSLTKKAGLDESLAHATQLSTDEARVAIEEGRVFVDGRRTWDPRVRIRKETRAVLHEGVDVALDVAVEVVFENEAIVVVDKQAFVHVNETETNAALSLVEILRRTRADIRVVHRLDRETSGVMVFAKNADVAKSLSAAFAGRTVKKRYLAFVEGDVSEQLIDQPIAKDRRRPRARRVHISGQVARTKIRPLSAAHGLSAVVAEPITGRTHQIRVHLGHLGHPLLGDSLYGGCEALRLGSEIHRFDRVMLHAAALQLPEHGRFSVPPPPDMCALERHGLALDGVRE